MYYDFICFIDFETAKLDIYDIIVIVIMFLGFYFQRREYSTSGIQNKLDKKADYNWVKSQFENIKESHSEYNEEVKTLLENINESVITGNNFTKEKLITFEKILDREIHQSEKSRDQVNENKTKIELIQHDLSKKKLVTNEGRN